MQSPYFKGVPEFTYIHCRSLHKNKIPSFQSGNCKICPNCKIYSVVGNEIYCRKISCRILNDRNRDYNSNTKKFGKLIIHTDE